MLKQKGMLVGAGRFELPTPGPPDRCANRAALRSDVDSQGLAAYGDEHKSGIAHRLLTACCEQASTEQPTKQKSGSVGFAGFT